MTTQSSVQKQAADGLFVATAAIFACIAAGCGSSSVSPSVQASISTEPRSASPEAVSSASSPPQTTTSPTAPPEPARVPAALIDGVDYLVSIDPADFSAVVTNPYFPLTPGTRWTFDGAGEHVVVTVTDGTRLIAGISTVVVHDQAFEGRKVVEDTEDYYAQDAAGNVWYLGEVTGECDGRNVTSRAGSWLTGVDGAQPGIVMLADPRTGDLYRQEYLIGDAEDQAKVLRLDGSVDGPTGSYDAVVVTEETTPLEPDLLEHKSYARGVGVVQERSFKADPGVVRLTKMEVGVPAPLGAASFSPCQG
jgi:hypothetical protein